LSRCCHEDLAHFSRRHAVLSRHWPHRDIDGDRHLCACAHIPAILREGALMIWIFALGIIYFCLVHEGFRKVVFWIAGIGATLFIIVMIGQVMTFKG
jgi:hypothetical protein